MATKKLSEALAELQKAANVSGLDIRLVVAGQSSTDNAQTITLQQLLTAINVPTVQTGAIGNNKQFVYSISTDNPHAVMSGTFKAFQFNGQCLIRHKFWGSTNDYTDRQYTTCEIPKVTTGANGVFEAAMLVRLRNTTLTEVNSTTDKVVVNYPNYANGSTKNLEITKATTAKAGVMTVDQVKALDKATTDISTLRNYIVGELGSYDSAEDFKAALTNMTKDTHKNGRYFAKVGDVPLFVTFEVLNVANNILCQWVEGAVTVGSNVEFFPNVTTGVRIVSRIYADNAWGDWHTSALKSDIPVEQTDYDGYEGKYIYAHRTDPNRQVLSGNFKVISVSNGVEIQHRIWGATEYIDATTKKARIPIVNPSQYGVMNKDVYKRLIYHTHYENGSTTEEVHIKYTNYETGGTNDLIISAASSAKAGVMTSEQYNQLKDVSTYLRGSLGTFTTTDAFKAAMANMPTTHKGMYGRYYAVVSGTNVYITFVLLEESSNTFAQWIEGAFIKSATDGDIYLNNELGVHIIGRVYRDGAWGMWRSTVLDDEVNSSGTSTEKQYLKWDSANHKYTYVATEAESDAVIPIANGTKDGLMTKEHAKSLSEIQSSYKDLGNFASEDAALAKIKSLEVCADSNIVHAHLTYANGSGKNTIILIQSIDNTMCRQIIFNKMKAFHRTITFTDASRTAISTQEDWMFLFGDRLQWSKSGRKYVLSQFGQGFGHDYTEPIPLADTSTDGLMSKEDKALLEKIKTKLEL